MNNSEHLISNLKVKLLPIDAKTPDNNSNLAHAAVLIPLIIHPKEITILFTKRTVHLSNHPGQVSFPGGRLETQDNSLLDAALRETYEEIGINAELIQILGQLKPIRTVSGQGFLVHPFVGIIKPPLNLQVDPHEVAAVFETPLSFLLDSKNYQRKQKLVQGEMRQFYVIEHENHVIWGATAAILWNLKNVM